MFASPIQNGHSKPEASEERGLWIRPGVQNKMVSQISYQVNR